MGPMGHEIPNTIGVDQEAIAVRIRQQLPGFMAMGEHGMSEHAEHTEMGHMQGPENTLPMMAGKGPFGNVEMGGMFTVVKIRDNVAHNDFRDPGWYPSRPQDIAKKISSDPNFGTPVRKNAARIEP